MDTQRTLLHPVGIQLADNARVQPQSSVCLLTLLIRKPPEALDELHKSFSRWLKVEGGVADG
ncbi:hypothetical protein DWC19_02660 [Streptomyces sp. M7]|nr:hypothetical protein DWC19_02660 [Streptomyces sp. M7]